MKLFAAPLILLAGFAPLGSFASQDCAAADETMVTVSCKDARENIRDAGYLVNITSGGQFGLTLATVLEQTFAGPRVVGTVAVRESTQGTERIYESNGFKLTIQLESFVPTRTLTAAMTYRQVVRGGGAPVLLNARLICALKG